MTKTASAVSGEGAPLPARQPDAGMAETCTCTVRLANDVRNEVVLRGVTPPELILLRHLHGGAESVVNVIKDGEIRFGATNERIRLLQKYQRHAKLIAEMFPGLSPRFPTTLAEAQALADAEFQLGESVAANSPLE